MNYKNAKEYVIKEMKKMLGPDFKTIQGKTFHSKGFTATEVVDTLLIATDMILFPDGKYLFRFMLDRYEVLGAREMLDIIQHFINWIDLDGKL